MSHGMLHMTAVTTENIQGWCCRYCTAAEQLYAPPEEAVILLRVMLPISCEEVWWLVVYLPVHQGAHSIGQRLKCTDNQWLVASLAVPADTCMHAQECHTARGLCAALHVTRIINRATKVVMSAYKPTVPPAVIMQLHMMSAATHGLGMTNGSQHEPHYVVAGCRLQIKLCSKQVVPTPALKVGPTPALRWGASQWQLHIAMSAAARTIGLLAVLI
jgi:hypothetical protein